MAFTVWIQLVNGQERTYQNVTRIDDTDEQKVNLYDGDLILAIISKSDLKNLLTEKCASLAPDRT
jgi:hypothetical protein